MSKPTALPLQALFTAAESAAFRYGYDCGWARRGDVEEQMREQAVQEPERFSAQMRTLARTEATENHGPAWADLVAGGGDAA